MLYLNRTQLRYALLLVSFQIFGQTILPWDDHQPSPDFGISIGPTAYLNYARPLGYPGVQLHEYSDLTRLNLISGQPDRLLSPWWIGSNHNTRHTNFGPTVFTEFDTAASHVMINYKQGDSEFKDFAFTYEHALSKSSYLGFVSETRSHVRYIDVTDFDQQDHQIEYFTETKNLSTRVRAGYNRLRTPLYTLIVDPILLTTSLDADANLQWDRYTGSVESSFSRGKNQYRLVFWQQGGEWLWADSLRNQWNTLALGSWDYHLSPRVTVSTSAGYWRQTLGEWQFKVPLTQASFSRLGDYSTIEFGVKTMDRIVLPNGDAQFNFKKTYIGVSLTPLLQYDLARHKLSATSVGQTKIGIRDSTFAVEASAWQGLSGLPIPGDTLGGTGGTTAGRAVIASLDLRSQTRLSLGYEKLTKGTNDYYTFDDERLTWRFEQHVAMFNNAMLVSLNVWGSSHFNVRSAVFNPVTFDLEPPFVSHSNPIHRVNYSIQARIRDVTIAFTDRNVLQDSVWQQSLGSDWQTSYTVMSNLPQEDRFRYLTVVWYFTN